jgi:hypothetical protein
VVARMSPLDIASVVGLAAIVAVVVWAFWKVKR